MQNTIKLIISGDGDFKDYAYLKKEADIFTSKLDYHSLVIVSDGELGVGALSEKYAKENNYKIKLFKADKAKFGSAAELRRNEAMAKYASHLLVFWNSTDQYTKSIILLAKKEHVKLKLITI